MAIALASILAAIFLLSVLLDKTLRSVSAKELRRRARGQKDKKAAAIYKLASFGRSSNLIIRLLGSLSAAGLIIVAARESWWLAFVVILFILWLVWSGRPSHHFAGWRFAMAAFAAPLFATVVSFLQPILGRFFAWRGRFTPSHPPTGLYEKEDLLELLKIQARQSDNRVSESDLKTARGALTLSDKTVGDVMLPRRQVKWVSAHEQIGPLIMDELHQSGQIRFPVVKEITKATNPEIVGVLYLKDLLNHLEDKGRIRDIMYPGVSFINEAQNLRDALDGFLKSGWQLLVVINNFEEMVGVLTIDEVLEQLFAEKIVDDFDQYHDVRSVASYEKRQSRGQASEAEVE